MVLPSLSNTPANVKQRREKENHRKIESKPTCYESCTQHATLVPKPQANERASTETTEHIRNHEATRVGEGGCIAYTKIYDPKIFVVSTNQSLPPRTKPADGRSMLHVAPRNKENSPLSSLVWRAARRGSRPQKETRGVPLLLPARFDQGAKKSKRHTWHDTQILRVTLMCLRPNPGKPQAAAAVV